MMNAFGATAAVFSASIFIPAVTASPFRSTSRHAEVPKALIQTRVSLDRNNCQPGELCASDDSILSTMEIETTHQVQDVELPVWAEGGLLTMHGCECADDWQFDGYTYKGCAVVTDRRGLNISQPLCFVKDAAACKGAYAFAKLSPVNGSTGVCENEDCDSPKEASWDFCNLVKDISPYKTHSSCHCSYQWEFQSKLYNGCSIVNGSGWCYVAETAKGCAAAKAAEGDKTQRWDTCNLQSQRPAYLTRSGCHCKPKWTHSSKEYSMCVSKEEVAMPQNLAESAMIKHENLLGWCQVFDDTRLCPASIKADDQYVDVCFMADEATITELDITFAGCHCQPEWSLNNETYYGCSKTKEGQESSTWCPVVEDESICSQMKPPSAASEVGEGRGGWNWDHCTSDKKRWRDPHNRFKPHKNTGPVASWYKKIIKKGEFPVTEEKPRGTVPDPPQSRITERAT